MTLVRLHDPLDSSRRVALIADSGLPDADTALELYQRLAGELEESLQRHDLVEVVCRDRGRPIAPTMPLFRDLSRRRPTRQNCPSTGSATCARPPIPRRPRPTGGHALAVSTGARSAAGLVALVLPRWSALGSTADFLSVLPTLTRRDDDACNLPEVTLGSLTNSGIVNAAVVPSSRTSGTVRCPVSGSNSKEPYVNQGDRSVRNTSDTCSGTRLTATDANRARGWRSRERSRWR